MIPISAFMPEAVAAMLRKAPLTSDKVAFAWRTAVGPAVDKATRVDLRDGVLRVDARDRAWKREVERSAAIIRMRLDALLGPNVIRDVVVTADSPDDRTSTGAARFGSGSGAAEPARSADRSEGESGTGRRHR